jgi:ElaA protein
MNADPVIHWSTLPFRKLDVQLFHDIVRLRVDVFVVEQNCPYAELDGKDMDALHVVGLADDGSVVAYARILPPGDDGLPHVGRVVVSKNARMRGIGMQLMNEVLGTLRMHYGNTHSALEAQAHLQDFYRSLGYQPSGGVYPLDGIPHIRMQRLD